MILQNEFPKTDKLLFLDLEGTQYHHEIIEIGAVKLDAHMQPCEELKVYIKPSVIPIINPKILEITKINIKDLENGVGFVEGINKLKEMFWRDDLKKHEKLLFHGAKSKIDGKIDIHRGRHNNDFGQRFYAGESYEQAISFVSGFENSSVYYICFNDDDLTCKRYEVNQEWMMTIAYYRGALDEYKNHPVIKKL